MQRRELFKWVASSTVVASTTIVIAPGCQRESPKPAQSFVTPLRKHAMPDSVEPALTFFPLPQTPK
ncbi:MAG TPA: hypothetical protein VIV40_33335 [Kofleriaceae bacterium]